MFQAIARQSAIQLTSKLIATAIGLAVVALTTRALGPAGFGTYTTIVTFLQFAGILADLGLTMVASRSLGEGRILRSVLLGNILSFRVTTAAIAFALAPVVALAFPYPAHVQAGIALTAVALFMSSIASTLGSVFQAELRATWLAAAEIFGRGVLLIGTAMVAAASMSLTAYLWVLIVSSAATLGVTWWGSQRLAPHAWQVNLMVWKQLWWASWPIAVTIILNLAYFRTDLILLSLMKPAADVGLYGAAYRMLEVLLTVPAVVGGFVLPLAARLRANRDETSLGNLYRGTFDVLGALGLAAVVGAAVVGVPLMLALSGMDFAVAGELLLPVSLAAAGAFAAGAAGYIIYALDLQRAVIPFYLAAAIIALTGYGIFIPNYSYWGAAWVTAAVNLGMGAATVTLLWRRGYRLNAARWPKLLLATLALTLGLMLPLPLAARLIAGAALWLGALWRMKLMSRTEKQSIGPAPAVSIVLPTFNRAYILKRAIDSVLAQKTTAWELIIVDDGSSDDTATLVRPYLNDARVCYQPMAHQGLALAIQRGINESRAPIVTFLDSDDWYQPTHLGTNLDYLKAHPEVSAVHSNAEILGTRTVPDVTHPGALIDLDEYCLDSTLFLRRTLFAELLFNPALPLGRGYDLVQRARAAGFPVTKLPTRTYVYDRTGASSRTKDFRPNSQLPTR